MHPNPAIVQCRKLGFRPSDRCFFWARARWLDGKLGAGEQSQACAGEYKVFA